MAGAFSSARTGEGLACNTSSNPFAAIVLLSRRFHVQMQPGCTSRYRLVPRRPELTRSLPYASETT